MAESSLFPAGLDDTNIYEVVARLSTTLSADITAATTTIPLTSTTGFPTQGYIVIDNETIKYISVAVGSVDATGGRGHAGTAAAHTSTTQVLVAVTAAVFNKLRAGMIAAQSAIGLSGSTSTGSLQYKITHLPTQTSTTLVSNLNAQYIGGSTEGQLNVGYLGGSTAGQLSVSAAATAVTATNASNVIGVSTVSGITAMENEIIFTPVSFDLSSSNPATLTEVVGTSVAHAHNYLTFGSTDQADAPGFRMPRSYNGQSVTVEYLFSGTSIGQTHDMGIRGASASVGSHFHHNYDSTIYFGTQTAGNTNDLTLATKQFAALSLDIGANKIINLGLIGGTVTNDVKIHSINVRWNKG